MTPVPQHFFSATADSLSAVDAGLLRTVAPADLMRQEGLRAMSRAVRP